MTSVLLYMLFHLAAVSLAFPGYFEDDDEEDKHYSHNYVGQYYKITTPRLTRHTETVEPTVNTAQTLQQLFTHYADQELLRRRRHKARGDHDAAQHDEIKLLLGGEFMQDTWTVTETELIESETDPLPENVKHFLTSVTATRSPRASYPMQIHVRTKQLDSRTESKTMATPQRRFDGIYPFRTKGTKGSMFGKIFEFSDPIVVTTSLLTPSGSPHFRFAPPLQESHPAIARQGDPVTPSDVKTTEETVSTENDDPTSVHTVSQSEQDEGLQLEMQTSSFVVTTPFVYSTTASPSFGEENPKLPSSQSIPVFITQDPQDPTTFTIQVTSSPLLTGHRSTEDDVVRRMEVLNVTFPPLTYPRTELVNGTVMDWRQAVALRKGEYFDMKKFFRDGAMTTKRKRKYVFVTKGNFYRVCVLADYKSLIVSCSIDNAMTICVRNLYLTNQIFENEQGVRYNGTVVACPTTRKLKPGEIADEGIYTKICVNRRRTEFKIRCPPEGASWTAMTRCIDNYRRAPWRGPFDYMFGEAWVGSPVSCPEQSTTEQRYFYITMTCPTTSYPILDVEGLLALIANLTYDYEEDLVAKLNKSLYIFLSPPTTTTHKITTTELLTTTPEDLGPEVHDFGDVIAKCYHCGMDEPQIPYSAACNDAFANEMMDLMPVDHRARSRLNIFRKYCRWNDEKNWSYNVTDERSIYGKWSGGCGVRWIDITTVYTQRTCRNRQRPATGKNFASKRMAKLELALHSVDNGCITSPMAVLIPLSRAISLYGRFHACVCTGSFCNAAGTARAHWAAFLLAGIGLKLMS